MNGNLSRSLWIQVARSFNGPSGHVPQPVGRGHLASFGEFPGRLFSTTSTRSVPLAYTKSEPKAGSGQELKPVIDNPLFILHGLYGFRQQWQTIADALASKLGQTVYTVDARNHGASPHHRDHSCHAMSDDLLELMVKLKIPSASFIGHSMGGKAAMFFALHHNPELTDALIVVDTAPSASPIHTNRQFHKFTTAMKAFKIAKGESLSKVRSRAMKELGDPHPGIRPFILTNFVQDGDDVKWRVNLDAISQYLENFLNFPECQHPYTGPALFLAGGDSDYVTEKEKHEIARLFPNGVIKILPDIGHNIHIEKPDEFLQLITDFLANRKRTVNF